MPNRIEVESTAERSLTPKLISDKRCDVFVVRDYPTGSQDALFPALDTQVELLQRFLELDPTVYRATGHDGVFRRLIAVARK